MISKMTKTKQFFELYRSKAQGGKDFEDKHVVQTTSDANGNGDEVFKGSKVKPVQRKKNRLGYDPGEDKKVYEAVRVDKKAYNWGNLITVHDGNEERYPLQPEHQEKIKNLKPSQSTSFEDETGRTIRAQRSQSGQLIHLNGIGKNKSRTVAVAHKHFTESLDLSEDQIAEAIEELAIIEGVDLDEETFYELYERIVEASETNLSERNKDNKFKKDLYVAKLGKDSLSRNFIRSEKLKNRLSNKPHDHHLATPNDDKENTHPYAKEYDPYNDESDRHALRKTNLRKMKVAGRDKLKEASETNIKGAPTRSLRHIRNKVGTFSHEEEKRLLRGISSKGKRKVRESFIETYVKPSQMTADERIDEALAHLNESDLNNIKLLYHSVSSLNQANILSNLRNETFVEELLDFTISNRGLLNNV